LNRWIALYQSGRVINNKSIEPSKQGFKLVMDCYASSKHRNAGKTAERLLRVMKHLAKDFPELQNNLVADTAIMNSVLFSWANSGDGEAGRLAEAHLNDMEQEQESRDDSRRIRIQTAIAPDAKSYEYVLNAWSKSNAFDKARRALLVLRRLEKKKDLLLQMDTKANEYAHSLVINACAFSSNADPATQLEAFNIAVSVFDQLALNGTASSSLTFGWFIQACGRLQAPMDVKLQQIEKAFRLCCERGLVSDFVFKRLKGAVSESFLQHLLAAEGATDMNKRPTLLISDLPKSWTRRVNVPS
jgi:hypothetical protein